MTSPIEAMRQAGHDPVNKPRHYQHAVEPIDAFEAWYASESSDPVLCALLWQVNKYLVRAAQSRGDKAKQGEPALRDLKKAAWYLQRAIWREERR